MDNFIVRWYNQNRKMIWIVVLTIIGIIALIQTLNNYYKNNGSEDENRINSGSNYNKNNYSIISQETISEDTSEQSGDLIKDFFDFCNNGEIEAAYNIISTECKEELYPTIDDFKTKYYNKIFIEQKSYESMLWITTSTRHTYRVEIMADLLATGQRDNMPIEDYYTIIYEDGEYKLNISNYIGEDKINITKTQNDMKVNVLTKKIYMDYEIYEIQVQNSTGSKLIFNTKEKTNSIYIQDENELKYIAFLNEIPDSELEIINGITKTLEIKFNRGYKPTIDIKRIVFEDIRNNEQIDKMEIQL